MFNILCFSVLDWFENLLLGVVCAGWTWAWLLVVYWGARTEGSIVCLRGYEIGVLCTLGVPFVAAIQIYLE